MHLDAVWGRWAGCPHWELPHLKTIFIKIFLGQQDKYSRIRIYNEEDYFYEWKNMWESLTLTKIVHIQIFNQLSKVGVEDVGEERVEHGEADFPAEFLSSHQVVLNCRFIKRKPLRWKEGAHFVGTKMPSLPRQCCKLQIWVYVCQHNEAKPSQGKSGKFR